jgi:phosphate:Na+ symporter
VESYIFWIQFFAGFSLFFFGWHITTRSFRSLTTFAVQWLVSKVTLSASKNTIIGTTLGFLLLSSTSAAVMLTSLANSGLLNLPQTLSMILGGQIGSTVSVWLLAILPNQWFSFALVALGCIPFLVLQSSKFRDFGRLIFAIGVSLVGLNIFGEASKKVFLVFAGSQAPAFYLGVFLFSAVLSHLVRSQTITIALALAMGSFGVIDAVTGFYAVLGAHLSTAVTIFIASRSVHIQAVRGSAVHFFIKASTVIVFMAFIRWVDGVICGICPTGAENIGFQIALFHTAVSVVPALLAVVIMGPVTRLALDIYKERGDKEPYHIQILDQPMTFIPSLGIYQLKEEKKKLSAMIQIILELTVEQLASEKRDQQTEETIARYEDISDLIQKEIHNFHNGLEQFRLTHRQAEQLTFINRIVFELERIADLCKNVSEKRGSLSDNETPSQREALLEMSQAMSQLLHFYEFLFSIVVNEKKLARSDYKQRRNLARDHIRSLRESFVERLSGGLSQSKEVLTLSEMLLSINSIYDNIARIGDSVSPK